MSGRVFDPTTLCNASSRAVALEFTPLPPYSGIGWKAAPSSPRSPERMSDEILTVLEVATLLKVADKTVYTMAQKGEIPAFKVRGQWRFRRVDIDAWIQEQTTSRRWERENHE